MVMAHVFQPIILQIAYEIIGKYMTANPKFSPSPNRLVNFQIWYTVGQVLRKLLNNWFGCVSQETYNLSIFILLF